MAVVEEGPKMRRIIVVALLMAAAAVASGQNSEPFNPYDPNHPYRGTPTPTPNKAALSQVPPKTQSAQTNRNSSTATSTLSPPPNTRTMSAGDGGRISFGNGAVMIREGDRVMITDGRARYEMSRKDAKPPPAFVARYNCKYIKHWLDTHRVNDDWRWASIWWADHCL